MPPPLHRTLTARHYRPAADRWAKERARIFAPSWQLLCHESALEGPGEVLAETLAGYPVLAVRQNGGALKAFHNVCRHRAGPLVPAGRSRCEGALVCRYHGWSYALDGRLKSARDFGAAAGFDPRALGLFEIGVEVWRGLVFVALEPPRQSLSALLEPIERRLAGRDWSALRPAAERRHAIACDWKTYVENYLEGYHLCAVHPGLDAEIDSSRYVVTMEGLTALHEAPPRRPGAVYQGLWAWVWPNIGVNVYEQGLMIERMSPDGPGRCRLDYLYLTPDGEPAPEATLALSDAVTAEDVAVVEAVQINLDAGVYDHGVLSPRHEEAVAGFQSLVAAALELSPTERRHGR
jgi:choline monooxygenase